MSINIDDLDKLDVTGFVTGEKLNYPHPGEILLEEFLKPMNITKICLAQSIGV